ncbi:DUF397 domain-containing protein [Spirillospora sp. NPDC127200]
MEDVNENAWRKSSYSGSNGGDCIEILSAATTVAVRDSKDPHGPKLLLGREDFRRFAEAVKNA